MTPIRTIYFLQSLSDNPYCNLALEDYLFSIEQDKEFLMLWQNRPSVIVGRYQNTAEEINREYIAENNITVARRMSGGGAVYHDLGNLNYTIIVNEGSDTLDFSDFARPAVRAMKKFGVEAEFSGRNDIVAYPDPDMAETFCFSEENLPRKLSGCAQLSRNGRTLYHGCILVNSDTEAASAALRPNPAKYESTAVKSVRSRIVTLADLADRPVDAAGFAKVLKEEIAADFVGLTAGPAADAADFAEFAASRKSGESAESSGVSRILVPYELSSEAEAEIAKLAEEKYSTWQWNYGFYGDYKVSRIKRFDFGTLTVSLTAEEGIIKDLKISGDFFAKKDLSGLEEILSGCPIDSSLKSVLDAADCSSYIAGLKAEDLAGLIS
ncbi:MAG: hypothetical protein MJ186_01700 [Clostridia bacterium]|nr:hypothetical protein [Clostridia bacterium]